MLKSNLDKVYKVTKKRNKRKDRKLLNFLKKLKSRLDALGFKSKPAVIVQEETKKNVSNQGNTTSTRATPNILSSVPINEEDKKQQE